YPRGARRDPPRRLLRRPRQSPPSALRGTACDARGSRPDPRTDHRPPADRRYGGVLRIELCPAGLLLAAAVCQACSRAPSPPGPPGPTRPYKLGFTPFAYFPGEAAQRFTLSRIADDGDLIAYHIGDLGVPWPEALNDSFPYSADVMNRWNVLRSNLPAGHTAYLALNPINLRRDGLGDLWS